LPGTGKAVTYTFSHQAATGTGANTFSPTFNPNAAAVVFSVPSVTLKNNQSAAVDVMIAAPSSPLKGLYGGYIVATSDEEPASTSSPALSFVYFPRNSGATTVFALGWDGAAGIGASRAILANDVYEISVEVLKARGDPASPADTERVVLGKLRIARP